MGIWSKVKRGKQGNRGKAKLKIRAPTTRFYRGRISKKYEQGSSGVLIFYSNEYSIMSLSVIQREQLLASETQNAVGHTFAGMQAHTVQRPEYFLINGKYLLFIDKYSDICHVLRISESVMKNISTVFLQGVIVLIALVALTLLVVLPLTEGRAADLDLISIYSDPFILYGYAASIAFFVALYKAFRLLGYIGQNKVFSSGSVAALKSIKYCAIVLSLLIILAAVYIRIFHAEDDDPAGFLGICIVTTFVAIVIATASAVFEKILQNAIDLKSENDLTI